MGGLLRKNAVAFGPGDLFPVRPWNFLALAGRGAEDWTPPVQLLAPPRHPRRRRETTSWNSLPESGAGGEEVVDRALEVAEGVAHPGHVAVGEVAEHLGVSGAPERARLGVQPDDPLRPAGRAGRATAVSGIAPVVAGIPENDDSVVLAGR